MGTFAERYFDLSNQDPYIQSVIRPGQVLVKKMPYEYGAVIGPSLVLNTPMQTTIVTLADSDFALTSLAVGVNQTANGDLKFNRNLTIQITDLSTGKPFFSAPAVTSLVAGGGGFPFVYVAPRVIRPNSGLQIIVNNRDTAVTYYQMFVTLGGTRLFY